MKCRRSSPFVRQDVGPSLFLSESGTVPLLRSSNSAWATKNQDDTISRSSRNVLPHTRIRYPCAGRTQPTGPRFGCDTQFHQIEFVALCLFHLDQAS